MEIAITRTNDKELQHHGIKGQRWGQRRYQNKDGSLTPAGQKRYNKEMEKLKADKAKLRSEKKVAAERKKTQDKLDKLEAEKKKVAEQRKALKEGDKKKDDVSEETPEQKRERLLKSVDAKELYKNKELLTDAEINARINRIDLENKLQGRIVEERKQTGLDYMNEKMQSAAKTIDNATTLYKSVDNAYSTVANSAVGKVLAKKLGIEPPKKEFNLDDFYKNINKKSAAEIKEVSERIKNEKSIKDEVNRRENKEKADKEYAEKQKKEAEAKKQVDKYNKRWQKDGADDKVTSADTTYSKTGDSEKVGTGSRGRRDMPLLETIEKVSGTVEGVGTSSSKFKDDSGNSSKKRTYTEDDIIDMEVSDSSMSSVPAVVSNRGKSAVAGLLPELSTNSNKQDDVKYTDRKKDGDDWIYIYDE